MIAEARERVGGSWDTWPGVRCGKFLMRRWYQCGVMGTGGRGKDTGESRREGKCMR